MYILPKLIRKIFGFPAIKNSVINKKSKIDVFSIVVNCKIGKYSYIGEHSSVINVEFGSFTSVSNYCAIGGGNHALSWISTSPLFNSSTSILHERFSDNEYDPFLKTYVGNDVWIGTHCIIRAGVKISDGAVIGMGSIVTKDIGPYEVWAGNPAKMIRKRFDDKTIKKLMESQWWNWPIEKIKLSADTFNSVDKFVGYLK